MIARADAFRLPFSDGAFDIVVADPPYDIGKNKAGRGKRGVSVRPYVGFKGREWWHEAWRVLADTGRLYVFCAVTELHTWLSGSLPPPSDVLAWHAPNGCVLASLYSTPQRRRGATWRPIIEWGKPGAAKIQRVDGITTGNSISCNLITSRAAEGLSWPNQIPLGVMRWLIAPVPGPNVLDLFAGTGTARIAAESLGKRAISVELAPEAISINRRRQHALVLEPAT